MHPPDAPAGPPPPRVGPYRLLEELGRGGTGVVYLAERADGQFRQRVALKIIPDPSPDMLARVAAERQILAALEHPNIARLVDGGVAEDGRPYLVMEYVAGLPIDVYADRMRLNVRERLELFVVVARAVEHAHRNLVVHRDLKPGNILVTTDGTPKLLDFGIAKLLNPVLTVVETPVTHADHLVLTPEYASPEQLLGETLTTASDVYSLGVVLYRLLTGHLPHGGPSVAALVSSVLEKDPERPSVVVRRPRERLAADGTRTTVSAADAAAARATTPDRLARALQGDVDAVVLMALRREPARRYGSAEQLAQDLERHLRGQVVEAHRGSRWYRARKYVRRHRVPALAAGLVALSLLVGAGGAAWQAGIARRQAAAAQEARTEAEGARAEAQEVADFLMALFEAGNPESGDEQISATDLLRRGQQRADELADQPAVQARMLDVLGRIHGEIGLTSEGLTLMERAAAIRRSVLGPRDPDLADTNIHMARLHRAAGRAGEARRLVEEALAIRREAFGENDPLVAEALYELGWISELPEQEDLYRQALDVLHATGRDPAREAELLEALATNVRRQGRMDEAVELAREALGTREAALGVGHPGTAVAMFHLGDHLRDGPQDLEEAERLYRRGLELVESRYGPNHLRLIHGIHSLATLEARRGNFDAAVALWERSLAIRTAALGPASPIPARSMEGLANTLLEAGRVEEASTWAERALALTEERAGTRHPSIVNNLAVLADIRAAQGRLDEARALYQRAFALRDALGGLYDNNGAELRRRFGRVLVAEGRFEEAEPLLLAANETLARLYAPDHPNAVDGRRALYELYTAWGRPAEAVRWQVPPGAFYAY